MHSLLRLALVPAVALYATHFAAAADAITLQQQWQTGKRYKQTMKMEQASTMEIAGQKMDQKMEMNTEMTTTATRHEDGKRKRLAMKYDRLVMTTEMMGQKMTFDSSQPADASPMGNPFAGLAGKEVRVLLDEKDKVVDFENFDEFAKSAGGANPITAGFLSKDSLKQIVQNAALQALPPGPVKPGDSWPFNVTMPMGQLGNVGLKGTYTFLKMTPRDGVPCAEIAMDAQIAVELAADAAPGGASAAQMGMKIEGGALKGTMWFDNALGTTRAQDFSQEMTLKMKNPVKPDEEISVPMKQHITSALTSVEDVK